MLEMENKDTPTRIDRRKSLKWMASAAAAAPFLGHDVFSAGDAASPSISRGYGLDPDMVKVYNPGELWPLTFSDEQRQKVTVLCDIIMPADETSPSASSLGVQDFIDEWISSPYPDQAKDRKLILKGLDWLDEEAAVLGAPNFLSLEFEQQTAMCHELAKSAKKSSKEYPGSFFLKMRDLISGGYYTTPEGMKDIGYVGNVAQIEWNGPPPEALAHLGLSEEDQLQ